MLDQLTLLLATPIAKIVLDKFYEGVGSKLGEKAIDVVPEKVKQLGQLIWDKCLKGKPNTQALLEEAANGSVAAQQKLADYLKTKLEADQALQQQAQQLAADIHLEVNNDFGTMNQTNRDQSTGYQTKTGADNTNFFGGTHHHH